jgi:hypothetical protein
MENRFEREWIVKLSIAPSQGPEKRLVYGIVQEPDSIDSQGDIVSASEIEEACHRFMIKHQQIYMQHKSKLPEVKVVENWIAPQSFNLNGQEIKKGSWVMAVKIPEGSPQDDQIWEDVKSGEITGFSIRGWARREKTERWAAMESAI